MVFERPKIGEALHYFCWQTSPFMEFINNIIEGHSGAVYAVIPGATPGTVISAGGDGFVVEWGISTGKQQGLTIRLDEPVFSIFLHRQRNILVAGTASGAMHCIDLSNKKETHHYTLHRGSIYHFAQLDKAGLLLAAGGDGVLSCWRWEDMGLERSIPLGEMKLKKIAVRGDEQQVAVAGGDGTVRIFESGFFNEVVSIEAHETGASALAWHPAKKVLVSGGKDGFIRCWNTENNFNRVLEFPAHKSTVYAFAYRPDGAVGASCSLDKTIKIWDGRTFDPLARLQDASRTPLRSVNDLCWVGETLISGGDDRRVITWKAI